MPIDSSLANIKHVLWEIFSFGAASHLQDVLWDGSNTQELSFEAIPYEQEDLRNGLSTPKCHLGHHLVNEIVFEMRYPGRPLQLQMDVESVFGLQLERLTTQLASTLCVDVNRFLTC